jgi:hypothetical protein
MTVASVNQPSGTIVQALQLFQDGELEATVLLHTDGTQESADATSGSTLFANDFANVFGGDTEFENCDTFAFNFLDSDGVGRVNERLCDLFH